MFYDKVKTNTALIDVMMHLSANKYVVTKAL